MNGHQKYLATQVAMLNVCRSIELLDLEGFIKTIDSALASTSEQLPLFPDSERSLKQLRVVAVAMSYVQTDFKTLKTYIDREDVMKPKPTAKV